MKKVCIILCYFGKFPETIDTFWYSCKANPEFNWLIFTDCETENVPENVKVVKTSLDKIKQLAEKKLQLAINLESPYKLCDYKVAYGLIFEDYLKGYDFWGYGDLDVVYGDLKAFITDELLDKYDKIYPLGHLSLLRNNEECRRLFMLDIDGTRSYKGVFSTPESCFFDEDRGINDKAEAAGLKLYTKFDFADIDGTYKRFRNVDKKTLRITLPGFKYIDGVRKNYKSQLFYCSGGKLYQRYLNGASLEDEEIAYIHYRRKLRVELDKSKPIMIIAPCGIVSLDHIPRIAEIEKYNGMQEHELRVFIHFAANRIRNRAPAVVKDKAIAFLGKSMLLRRFVRRIKGKEEI